MDWCKSVSKLLTKRQDDAIVAPSALLAQLNAGGLQLLDNELGLFIGTSSVVQVRGQDGEGALADCIAGIADDVRLLLGEVGDLGVVLVARRVSILCHSAKYWKLLPAGTGYLRK